MQPRGGPGELILVARGAIELVGADPAVLVAELEQLRGVQQQLLRVGRVCFEVRYGGVG